MSKFFLNDEFWYDRNLILKECFLIFAAYVPIIYAFVLAVLLFWFLGWYFTILVFLFALFSRYFLSEVIHRVWQRPRPYQKYKFKPAQSKWFTTNHRKHDSFPSDHAWQMTFLVFVSYFYSLELFVLGLFFLPFMGLSRVLLGFHYVSDVVFGMLFGYASFWLFLGVLYGMRLYQI